MNTATLAVTLAILGPVFGCAADAVGARAVDLYPEEIETARAEWAAVYGSAPSLDELRVVVPSDEAAYGKLCDATDAGAKGCFSIDASAIVVRRSWAHEDRNTVTHEAMHALGLRAFGPGGGDAGHHDAAIWDGVLARTNAALGLPRD